MGTNNGHSSGILSCFSSRPQFVEQPRAELDPLHKPYRRLTLFVTSIALISNLVLAYLYNRLPDDPLHLAWHLQFYTYFAIVLSLIGFVGARKVRFTARATRQLGTFIRPNLYSISNY